MCKKLLLFVSLLGLFLGNFNYLSAEILTPLKKPKLTEDEISIRISKNILKPVKKPKKVKKKEVEEIVEDEEEINEDEEEQPEEEEDDPDEDGGMDVEVEEDPDEQPEEDEEAYISD